MRYYTTGTNARRLRALANWVLVAVFFLSACSSGAPAAGGGDTIKIGLQSDLSGDLAWPQPANGVQLAVDDINAAGGLLGKQVKIVMTDTQSDTTRYVEMAKKMILQDGISIMFGSGTSSAREAMRPLFEENKVLYNYMTNYEGGVASNYVICTGTIPAHNILPIVEYAAENLGKNAYVVAADYNYGHLSVAWFKEYAKDYGINIVGEEFIPLSVSQYSTTINNIQAKAPDFLYILAIGTAQRSFFDQWAAINPDIPIVSSANFGGNYEHKLISPPALADSYYCVTFNEELDASISSEFVEKWMARFPKEQYVNGDGYGAYQSVMLWAEAVKKAGTADPEKVAQAYNEGVSVETPTGTFSVDPASHQLVADIYMLRIDENHNAQEINHFPQVLDTYLADLGVDLRVQERTDFFTLE